MLLTNTKEIMKTFNLKLACTVFLSTILFLSLFGCDKDELTIVEDQATDTELLSKKGKPDKIDVCHYSADNDQWILINVKESSWADHVLHGDVRLDDQDGDGFVPDNACGFGTMGDCDDTNAAINPGAEEICDNGIDDNCNGEVDEGCVECSDVCNNFQCEIIGDFIVPEACYTYDGSSLRIRHNNGDELVFDIPIPGDTLYDCYIYFENLVQESGMPECDLLRLASQPNEKEIIMIE